MTNRLIIDTPPGFNFKTAVYSHGWCDLSPFNLNSEDWILSAVFNGIGSGPVTVRIFESDEGLMAETESVADRAALERTVQHVLRLDEDLSSFYRLTDKYKRLKWVSELNAGRLLRSPTVWEDLVKTLCTTNCSWGLTKIMVGNLVSKLGSESVDGNRAFPTAEQMVQCDESFFRSEIKAGYRAPYFVELAERVVSGDLDPEVWLSSDLPTPELKKEMKKVKGVGDYAAENLLKLVGRYDGLALDSWLRAQFYKKHNRGEVCDDKQIGAYYEKFGPWRGLAIWCDMTEKWH